MDKKCDVCGDVHEKTCTDCGEIFIDVHSYFDMQNRAEYGVCPDCREWKKQRRRY